MDAVFDELLKQVEADPLPAGHTSVYWQQYGRGTVVERRGEALVLKPYGFESPARPSARVRAAHWVERLLYRPVTARYHSFSSIWCIAERLARDLSSDPKFHVFKAACALSVLSDYGARAAWRPTTLAVIGDGFGFLGALSRRVWPGIRLYCVDLPKTLVFQARTHQTADPHARLAVRSGGESAAGADIVFITPPNVELVDEMIDCAISVASMQEMTTASIAGYFTFLRRRSTPRSRFYCVNRLDKELPGEERTRFYDYPWQADDEIFLDEPCPYYQHFIAPYTLCRGPRILGIRVPYLNYFDGVHLHRLVRLTPQR